jgi:hypothetical protein
MILQAGLLQVLSQPQSWPLLLRLGTGRDTRCRELPGFERATLLAEGDVRDVV